MATPLILSEPVRLALELALIHQDSEALADAFAEMYCLAQSGYEEPREDLAGGIDAIAIAVLTRNTGQ
jgi:hypothetical protein